jgi:Cyclin, N-terminal domain/Cyclin, C-terminal domain
MQEVTLHLCVAIMDRFLASIQYIDKEKLELVMIASLRLAATIEEDTVLSLPCAQQKFSGSDILDMEKYILKTLKHVIQVPSAFPFLFRFLELVDATDRQRSIATYYLETSILNFHFHQYRPSILAYCSALLAINNPFFRTGQAPGVVRLLNPSRSGYPVTKTSRIIFTPPQPRALETYAGFELSLALKIMSEMCDTFRTCTLASSIIRLRYRGLILPDASPASLM